MFSFRLHDAPVRNGIRKEEGRERDCGRIGIAQERERQGIYGGTWLVGSHETDDEGKMRTFLDKNAPRRPAPEVAAGGGGSAAPAAVVRTDGEF